MTEIDLTPVTRLEYDIDAILNDHAVAEPITRIELILADIVAGNTTTVVPVTRIETYLAIISGADYPVPEPVTRIETFLAIIAGEDYEEPEAVTRLEGLLAEWVEKGSGIWKTVTGTLIHLTDALASPVQALSVAIEPQQELHGYDAPYPPGGSNNLIPDGTDTSNGYVKGYYLKVDGTTASSDALYISEYFPVTSGNTYTWNKTVNDSSVASVCFYDSNKDFISGIATERSLPKTFVAPSGAVYCRSTQKQSMTDVFQLELGSTATVPMPYSNICPISGWTGCNIKRANKNLMILDRPYKIGGLSYSTNVGGTFAPGITAEGTYSFVNDIATLHNSTAWRGVAIGSQPVKAGSYYFSITILSKTGTGSSEALDLLILDKDYTILRKVEHWSSFTTYQYRWSFTVPQDNCYIVLDIGGRSSTYLTVEITDIQLELGTERTEYQRPNIATYPISWQTEAGTVYGGMLTINEGGSVDLVSEMANISSYNGETINEPWLSSIDKYVSGATPTTGAQVVYTLAEPITYHLDSIERITTLAGENNIWADVNGEITLTYQAVPETAFSDNADTGMADYMTLTE